MAIFYPDDHFEAFKHMSERDVAKALKATLGLHSRVYHGCLSLHLVPNYGGKGDHLKEGEIDFILLDQEYGLLVIEVKGGPVLYDTDNGRWYYDRVTHRQPMADPIQQARDNLHALEKRLLGDTFKGYPGLPCPYGYAVVFPHHNIVGTPPPGADHAILIGKGDMEDLGGRLIAALKKWRHTDAPGRMSSDIWRRMREGLTGSFRLIEVLSSRVDAQEEELVRLTRDQETALKGLYSAPRVKVSGAAGSGKTMLAMARAKSFAREGKLTLFLCYNRWLADWLEQRVPDELKALLHVKTFNGLCAEYCTKAGIKYQPPPDEDWEGKRSFFEQTAPTLLDNALNRVPRRYHAVVVDEAQDFRPHWWTPIELLNVEAEEGLLYVFYDPDQNLFVEEALSLPGKLVLYQLPANCRNTVRIAELCGTVLGKSIPVRDGAPVGAVPVEEVVQSKSDRRDRCNHQVREWIKGGLKPSQVAILCPWTWQNSCLAGVKELSGTPLLSDPAEWQADGGVLVTTIRAFKGLEADALILVDIPAAVDPQRRSEFYVACSRAKHLLRILYTEPRGF